MIIINSEVDFLAKKTSQVKKNLRGLFEQGWDFPRFLSSCGALFRATKDLWRGMSLSFSFEQLREEKQICQL
ncbi:hypothetical protein DHB64_13865 [Antarcticibacterium sp. W02-3]|nr:hypothetical protein [Antarcticibacterium sp. W02-3]